MITNPPVLRLAADYMSTGLWGEDHTQVELDSIPLSQELRDRIVKYVDDYEKCDFFLHRGEETYAEACSINETGLRIAKDIKKELPDYWITYYDEVSNVWLTVLRCGSVVIDD